MENLKMLQKFLFMFFSVSVSLLGANDVLHRISPNPNSIVTKDNFFKLITFNQLSLDQSRFTSASLKKIILLREKNGVSDYSHELLGLDDDKKIEEI